MNLRTFSRCFPGFYRKCFFPPGILGQVTRNAARLGHVSKRAPLRRGGRGQPGQGRHGFIATNRKAPNRFRKLNSNHSNPKLSANSTYFAFLRLLHCNITLKKLNIWFSWVLNVDEESVVFTSFILARQSWSPSIHCTETWLLGTGGPGGGGATGHACSMSISLRLQMILKHGYFPLSCLIAGRFWHPNDPARRAWLSVVEQIFAVPVLAVDSVRPCQDCYTLGYDPARGEGGRVTLQLNGCELGGVEGRHFSEAGPYRDEVQKFGYGMPGMPGMPWLMATDPHDG